MKDQKDDLKTLHTELTQWLKEGQQKIDNLTELIAENNKISHPKEIHVKPLREIPLSNELVQNETSEQITQPNLVEKKPKKAGLRILGNIAFYLTVIGVVLGVALFGTQEPSAAPRNIMGYSVMTVLSGSMQPTIPTGSLVAIRAVNPREIQVGDVVTYLRPNNTTVTHRVIEILNNYQGSGNHAFRLQGDNNLTPDAEVVLEHNIIGEVFFNNLMLGRMVSFIQDAIILIVILLVLAIAGFYVIKKFFFVPLLTKKSAEAEMLGEIKDQPASKKHFLRKRTPKEYFTLFTSIFFIAILGYSLYQLSAIYFTYESIARENESLRETYTTEIIDQESARTLLEIDWESLHARNKDVIAWLHLPGTSINYPVLAGVDNDEYIALDINRQPSIAGSIFLEEANTPNFNDKHTILYGHHMQAGGKFSDIDAFVRGNVTVNDAPFVYIYLPDGAVNIYRTITSEQTTIASKVYHLPVTDLTALHDHILTLSDDSGPSALPPNARILTLSTCSVTGEINEYRSLLFAVLVEEINQNG